MPSVPTIISRAASEVISPMPIFQLKPSGLMAGSTAWPIMPAKLSAICGGFPFCSGRFAQHPEHHGHQQDHGAGAAQEDFRAIDQPQAERRKVGQR